MYDCSTRCTWENVSLRSTNVNRLIDCLPLFELTPERVREAFASRIIHLSDDFLQRLGQVRSVSDAAALQRECLHNSAKKNALIRRTACCCQVPALKSKLVRR